MNLTMKELKVTWKERFNNLYHRRNSLKAEVALLAIIIFSKSWSFLSLQLTSPSSYHPIDHRTAVASPHRSCEKLVCCRF